MNATHTENAQDKGSSVKAYRKLSSQEITDLGRNGSYSSDWSLIEVSLDFVSTQIIQSRIEGRLKLDSKARVIQSTVSNYHLGENVIVDSVTKLECRHISAFGNGVKVATINECGGREVKLYQDLSAQSAYIIAIYRHRPQLIQAMEKLIDEYTQQKQSSMCYVGANSRVRNVRVIREAWIGENVTIDGTSIIENATICDGAKVGSDVKAYNFIAAQGSEIDNGATINRCFIGEGVIVSNGFTAQDSLFFANSHVENGESVSIFAGPYTVSHHKSSLLIAGIFSFFNAGSGTNQSNHLFKSGAVHQTAHLRGCKFSSGAYVMSPAQEAPFTMVLGRHRHHHDTTMMPYSYLIEKGGKSILVPAANIINYGTARDLKKWRDRDKRTIKRDIINFEEHNPYICQKLGRAVEILTELRDNDPNAENYTYKNVYIERKALEKAIMLYNKAIDASIGEMLSHGVYCGDDTSERWLDLAGQYIPKKRVEDLLNKIEQGEINSLEKIDSYLEDAFKRYEDDAYSWAYRWLSKKRGEDLEEGDIKDIVEEGLLEQDHLNCLRELDLQKDCSMAMSISYGLDSFGNSSEIKADYERVRGLL